MSKTYEIEIELAGEGRVYFSIKDHPEFDYIMLPGQFCNENGIFSSAKMTIEEGY